MKKQKNMMQRAAACYAENFQLPVLSIPVKAQPYFWEAILGGKNGYDTRVPRGSKGGTCKNGNYAFYHISHTDIGVFNGVTTGRRDLVSIKTGQFVPWFGAQAGGRWSALRAARRSV